MPAEDLVLAGVASAILRNPLPSSTATSTTPTGSSPTVSLTPSQIQQIAGAVADGIRGLDVPAPVVNVPAPVVNVPPVQFPANLQVQFGDAEIQRLAAAMQGPTGTSRLIETRILTLDTDGTAVNAVFPTLRRLVTYQFTQSYNLIALSLSCSIANTTTNVAGLFVGRDLGAQVNIQQQSDTQVASDIFISQLTHQNSTITTIAPLSRTNTIGFSGDRQFIQIEGGSRLALYGCGDNDANNLYAAVVSLHLVAP